MADPNNLGQPILDLEFNDGSAWSKYVTLTPADLEGTKKKGVYIIGRDPATTDLAVPPKSGNVSRKHCSITYDNELGWIIKDEHSTSGTWAHPKTWTQFKFSVENSNPVVVWNEMVVKTHTYTLTFKI